MMSVCCQAVIEEQKVLIEMNTQTDNYPEHISIGTDSPPQVQLSDQYTSANPDMQDVCIQTE